MDLNVCTYIHMHIYTRIPRVRIYMERQRGKEPSLFALTTPLDRLEIEIL